jgi:hypothetical protein
MDAYHNSKDPYFNSAPEVAPPSIPERVHQDHEGPQPVQYPNQYGTANAYYGPGSGLEEKAQTAKGSKKMLILSIIGALVALAIGIGIGVGIGISVEKNNSDSSGTNNGYEGVNKVSS